MKKTKLITLLILAIILISCEKEDSKYPLVYSAISISDEIINVYTIDGKIADTNNKTEFIARHHDYLTNIKAYDLDNEGKLIVTYNSATGIEIESGANQAEKGKAYELNSIIFWEYQDTIKTFSPLSPHYSHRPLYYEEVSLAPTTGLSSYFLVKDCIYAKKKANKLVVPMINLVRKYGASSFWEADVFREQINNSFDEESYTTLNETDTVMVQEFNIELNRNP